MTDKTEREAGPPAGEEVEVLGYSYFSNPRVASTYKPNLLGKAKIVELVDRAHVTRLTAEVERLNSEVSYLTGTLKQIASDNVDLQSELTKARELLNTPHTDDWFEGVRLEAGHQISRWGTDHDAGKAPPDWFWLIGYLAQKAMTAQMAGNEEKARHHTISTGAAMLNWFRAIVGDSDVMRPGIDAQQYAPAAKGDSHE